VGAAIGREFSHGLLAAVLHKSEQELSTALERLIASGLLFRQGVPPHASYLFKHALVQDAAYGTLLREPRRELHSRIAEILERKFAETTENQPELVARHCTEAGQIEKAASLWGKAGLRSLERSALVEAVEQLTRALAQISILPPSPEQRREDIKLQAAIITPLIHVKGYAAPETRTAATRARLLIEQAEARAEAPDDPLVKFSALYGFLTINVVAFNGGLLRKLSAEFLTLAEEQHAEAPLMIGHRVVGFCLLFLGDIVESLSHIERTIELYQPAKHRPLATRFGTDVRVHARCYRSWAWW
jgi:predicted ATPase